MVRWGPVCTVYMFVCVRDGKKEWEMAPSLVEWYQLWSGGWYARARCGDLEHITLSNGPYTRCGSVPHSPLQSSTSPLHKQQLFVRFSELPLRLTVPAAAIWTTECSHGKRELHWSSLSDARDLQTGNAASSTLPLNLPSLTYQYKILSPVVKPLQLPTFIFMPHFFFPGL